MKRVLMVAFQFPPFAGSSAVQRTLRFVRYLPEYGWSPIVLTAQARAYEVTSDDQLTDIPAGTVVERALCFDAARHFGIARRYPAWAGRPDRWISWWPGAVFSGLRLIERFRPDALWSTFPIPSAHLIARTLHLRTGLPWIADFRDPMVQPGDPSDPRLWASYERVERATMRTAQLNVFTTPGTLELYRSRYPDIPGRRFATVENGYDEAIFADCAPAQPPTSPLETVTLLHSGAIYPLERDPSHLFRAIRQLAQSADPSGRRFRLRLRATGHDAEIRRLIQEHDVASLVEIAPAIAYRDAIAEMMSADALLVLQGSQVRTQVPAKIYEYLRARRPILALTDPRGDTAAVLRQAGVRYIAPSDSPEAIIHVLKTFLERVRMGHVDPLHEDVVRAASRQSRSRVLAELLERTVSEVGASFSAASPCKSGRKSSARRDKMY